MTYLKWTSLHHIMALKEIRRKHILKSLTFNLCYNKQICKQDIQKINNRIEELTNFVKRIYSEHISQSKTIETLSNIAITYT